MILAKLDKVKKYYSDRLILDIDKFQILEEEKIGLVGANGVGKTTLVKLLLGDISSDEGNVYLNSSFAYITQRYDFEVSCEESKMKNVLKAPDKFHDYLSGGEKVKLKIATALKDEKKLLIADEPTSNLDKESIEILEEMLKAYKGALFIVSHDRKFLDNLCTTIVELKNGKLKSYKGNYSTYLKLKEEEINREQFQYEQYINEKTRLEKAKIKKSKASDSIKKAPRRMGNSEARLHKMGGQKQKKKLDKNVKAIQSRIDNLEIKEKPKSVGEIKIYIQSALEIGSKNLIEVNDLTLYAKNKLLLQNVSFKVKRNKKIALLGKNASGKTSLLKEIVQNNNVNIRMHEKIKIGYFDQNQYILEKNKSILDNIKSSSSFNETFIRISLNLFGFKGEDVYKKIDILSGGEVVKVSLCKILLEDNNLLILDEPTNYLDVFSIEALEKALKHTDKTLILVSHDRNFIGKLCNYIVEIKDGDIVEFNGSYEEYLKSLRNIKSALVKDKNKEDILILENKLSNVLSIMCFENNLEKKAEYEKEYGVLLKKIKALKKN